MTDNKPDAGVRVAGPDSGRADHMAPPRPVGLVALAVTVGLLIVSSAWIARDSRFEGSRILTAATLMIMEEAFTAPAPEVMFRAAAAGLTADLDPFSGYLPPAEFGWFTEETEGEYVGIGVEVSASGGGLIVIHVFPRSPADAAMIRPGDRIVRIDDASTFGMTATEAASLMRGRIGTDVGIEVVTPGGEVRTITLPRERVELTPFPIVGISRSGAAYIRWTQFSAGSGDQLAALVADLAIQDPTGMILDLRGNPGGILDEAVAAAGVFLPPDQLICRVADRGFATRIEYRALSTPPAFTGPLVLVCDETSASASEVLAAALWEAGRAVVVGRRTFGKGWVQSILPLGDAGALRLSTARYYTAGGRSLGDPRQGGAGDSAGVAGKWEPGAGLIPDVVVADARPGVWERALSRRGAFGELAAVLAEDMAEASDDDELVGFVRHWCDSVGITPEGLAAQLSTVLDADDTGTLGRRRAATIRAVLEVAGRHDAGLLFARERDRLLLRIWEERLWSIGRPDPAELERYIDFDPDLAAARDLLEVPERYQALAVPRPPVSTPLGWQVSAGDGGGQ